MIEKTFNFFVLINYCAQRSTGSYFNRQSVINVIMFELSFITSAIPFAIISGFKIYRPWIGVIITIGFVFLLWRLFELKLRKSIDFEYLEERYLSIGKNRRLFYFSLSFTMYVVTFLFMLFLIKVIF